MPRSKPSIVAIGAGNLASHFVPALHQSGYEIKTVFSRKNKNAKELAYQVKAQVCTKLHKIDPTADVYLIMVPDHAIAEVTAQLSKIIVGEKQIICHSSGATDCTVFNKLKCLHGVFYALQSYSKDYPSNLKTDPFIIYGSSDYAQDRLLSMARKLSRKVITGDDEQRLKYHLTAVFVNNFVNHIHCKAKMFMDQEKLDPSILDPIIEKTYVQLKKEDSCQIQTGPARRGDRKTMKKHLNLLQFDKELADIYKEISDSITKHYK